MPDFRLNRNEPELELLFLCARLNLPAAHYVRLTELLEDDSLDWQKFLYNVKWHRLGGLVYHHLRIYNLTQVVPEWVAKELKGTYLEIAVKNVFLRSELRKVLNSVNERNIPVLILKGASLLQHIYVNPSLRYMSDIDLLVPEDRAEEVQQLVIDFGYSPVGTEDAQSRTRENHRHLPSLVNDDWTAAFEIHTHIVTRDSPLRFDLAGFWERSIPISIMGEEARTLAPEDMLTHLAMHFFLDRRFRSYAALAQLCDMAEVIRSQDYEIDWGVFEETAIGNGVHGPIYCALSLAKELLDAPVPDEVLERLKPSNYDDSLAERFINRRILDTRPVLASSMVTTVSGYGIGSLAKGVLTRLFPKKKYMSEKYPAQVNEKGMYGSYVQRWGHATSIVSQYIRNPMELWQQFQVDRWIHSIQNEGVDDSKTESEKYSSLT